MHIETGRATTDDVDRLLRSVPEWFGIPESNAAYVDAARTLPSWAAVQDDVVIGVCLVRHHTPVAAEMELLVVERDRHRAGIGRALVGRVEQDLATQGIRVLQVKTFGPSGQSAEYELTRQFYAAIGFLPLEESLTIWGEDTPCLIFVKMIG